MKILWFVDKQFDIALDKASWLETIKYLQRNHAVFLVTGYLRDKLQFPELHNAIIYINFPKIKFFKRFGLYLNQLKTFEKLVSQYSPTRIIFNTSNFLLLKKAVRIKEKYGYRCYLDIRTLPVSARKIDYSIDRIFFGYSLRTAAKYFDGITYITEKIKDYCLEKYALAEHLSEIWTSGVDLNLFRPEAKDSRGDPFKLIYHGNVAGNRGLDTVIRALDLIRDREVELLVLGSGDALNELRRLAAKLQLEGRVVFQSPVPFSEVPKYISQTHAGILPFPDWAGWNTSSPIKLFEYLACGKPVIVTKIPAHVDVLEGKRFAFWAEASTPEGIARAIINAIQSREGFEIIGQEARQFTEENFSWETQAKKLEKFLLEEEKTQNA